MTPPTPKSFYLPELDALRFFAFFAVFLSHNFPHEASRYGTGVFAEWFAAIARAGTFGVDLFFALSAYLITEILMRENETRGEIDAWAFYKRRAYRILPLFYAFVLAAIFIFPLFLASERLNFIYSFGFLFFAGNWACAIFGYPASVIAPLWSVSIEEQFYLIFPFLFRRFGVGNLKKLAFSILAIATVTRIVLVYADASVEFFWTNTFGRLDAIAGGILLAVSLRDGTISAIDSHKTRAAAVAVSVALFVLSAKLFAFSGAGALLLFPVAGIAATLLVWSMISLARSFVKADSLLVDLGRVSYGLYVFHFLGITLAIGAGQYANLAGASGFVWKITGGFLITLAFALLSYRYIEKPFLKLKNKAAHIKTVPSLIR